MLKKKIRRRRRRRRRRRPPPPPPSPRSAAAEEFPDEVAAAEALYAAAAAESDEEEEDAPAPVDEIPFSTQDEVDKAMKHSRTEKTLRSYEVSVNAMLTWCKQHQDEEMVKAVLKTGADGDI